QDFDDHADDDSTRREYYCELRTRRSSELPVASLRKSLAGGFARHGVQDRGAGDPSALAASALGSLGSFAQFRGFLGFGRRQAFEASQRLAVARDRTESPDLGQRPQWLLSSRWTIAVSAFTSSRKLARSASIRSC